MIDRDKMGLAARVEEVLTEDVITSLTGKTWRMRQSDGRMASAIAQNLGLDALVAHILSSRGVHHDHVPKFMQPRLRDWLPDPFMFRDMDKTAARIIRAIVNKEKVALFGDYDVDGATSTALMARFLRQMGIDATIYIPDRVLEGYGPNETAFQQLIDAGHSLIITLDCGVLAFKPIALARQHNVDVVVIDHHMALPELPDACAIVNPNRLDETAGFRYLAAVGVTFVALVGICRKLKEQGIEPPDLLPHLDLVALGTICDVVPMTDLNRAFVAQGLKVMARRENAGLKALCDVAGLDQHPNCYHAGFVLGPRLNAGGRISSSSLGVTLLSSECPHTTSSIALELHNLNKERQEMEKRAVEEAIGFVARDEERFSHVIVISSRDWHPGVIGLIAARLKEQFQRPACVISIDGNGKGKASGRSITGVDLGALIIRAHGMGHILEGGGHAMAAGFSVASDKIDALHQFMHEEMVRQFGPVLPLPEIVIDSTILPGGINLTVCNQLALLEPYGPGHPAPKLVLAPVRLLRADIVKEKHLRLSLTDINHQQRLSVMMFNQANTGLHQALNRINSQQPIKVLGSLKINSWQGREEAQFLADDIALDD